MNVVGPILFKCLYYLEGDSSAELITRPGMISMSSCGQENFICDPEFKNPLSTGHGIIRPGRCVSHKNAYKGRGKTKGGGRKTFELQLDMLTTTPQRRSFI